MTSDLVLAGRAEFTVETPNSYFTFAVWSRTFEDGNTRWFASQNTRKRRYIGRIDPACGRLRATPKTKMNPSDRVWTTLQATLDHLWHGAALPDGWTVEHAGTCAACGRRLTTPESMARGLGPECAGKANQRRIVRTDHLKAA